jgi:ubiquinone/menaquinone biosynthesis C-methylase UbiE
MDDAAARQQAVAAHYDGEFFTYEATRLSERNVTEYLITARYLTRHIAPGSVVADVGVGHYAHLLAEAGCRLHLVDVSQRLLDATTARLQETGNASALLSATRASATDLAHLKSASCDAVLLLGPLYHLVTLEERQAAVQEASRILRPGGLLFAAGVNRLTFLRDSFANRPETGRARYEIRRALYESGQFDADAFMSYSHLTTADAFRQLFDGPFVEVAFLGVESFAGPHREVMATLAPDDAAAWLDLVELSGTSQEGIAMSSHFLYIGRHP